MVLRLLCQMCMFVFVLLLWMATIYALYLYGRTNGVLVFNVMVFTTQGQLPSKDLFLLYEK